MNKRQKELLQLTAKQEKKVTSDLKKIYKKASDDCTKKITELSSRKDMENLQSIIYQKKYQEALKKQLDSTLDDLNSKQFSTLSEYIGDSYDRGFIGSLYDLQGQGVPLTIPIDSKEVIKAVQLDSKISEKMYTRLGEDVNQLKRSIMYEVSRGISNGSSWNDVAEKLSKSMNSPFDQAYNKSIRIARTEGHRVQCESAQNAMEKAQARGAEIYKRWDATLDGNTRDTHARLDGQTVPIDEPFEIDGMTAMFPSDFGDPAEDINCRCTVDQKAKWALDDPETKYLGDTSKMTDEQLKPIADKLNMSTDELRDYSNEIIPIQADSYDDFKKQYDQIWHPEEDKEKAFNEIQKATTKDEIIHAVTKSDDLEYFKQQYDTMAHGEVLSNTRSVAGKSNTKSKAITTKDINKMSRPKLAENARAVFIKENAGVLSEAEARRRFDAMLSSNTNTQLKKYLSKRKDKI